MMTSHELLIPGNVRGWRRRVPNGHRCRRQCPAVGSAERQSQACFKRRRTRRADSQRQSTAQRGPLFRAGQRRGGGLQPVHPGTDGPGREGGVRGRLRQSGQAGQARLRRNRPGEMARQGHQERGGQPIRLRRHQGPQDRRRDQRRSADGHRGNRPAGGADSGDYSRDQSHVHGDLQDPHCPEDAKSAHSQPLAQGHAVRRRDGEDLLPSGAGRRCARTLRPMADRSPRWS